MAEPTGFPTERTACADNPPRALASSERAAYLAGHVGQQGQPSPRPAWQGAFQRGTCRLYGRERAARSVQLPTRLTCHARVAALYVGILTPADTALGLAPCRLAGGAAHHAAAIQINVVARFWPWRGLLSLSEHTRARACGRYSPPSPRCSTSLDLSGPNTSGCV